ncbi:hypothetical protein SDC9_54222 [bioreactor metagenome]|uniref:ATPase n=1 Tax=bioreactor metagenome TaxID=1076179 RepID=A0A644WWD5_9ZZZZ
MTTKQVQYFLGANSPEGFYSLYDQLIDPAEAKAIYILKGGPGCGKSTLMRIVGQKMEDNGFSAEYILCSGDLDSLDAILIPGCATAIVDGTAPHVFEPLYPGVVESYLNLGECYDREKLSVVKNSIISCTAECKVCYQRAYRCLGAAAGIREDMREILKNETLEKKLMKRAKGIASREFKRKGTQPGSITQRFLSGVTHRGILCNFDTVDILCAHVYELADSYGLAHLLLEPLLTSAVAAGYDVIACPSPLSPMYLEHLIIPELSLAFVTSCDAMHYEKRPYRRIRLDAMADKELIHLLKPRIRFSKRVSAALIEEAVESLNEAKILHDKLEELYHPFVDFNKVTEMANNLAETILNN